MNAPVLESVDELTICAEASELRRASAWINQVCRRNGVPANETLRLEVCANETLANILAHGGKAALTAPVRLQFQVRGDAVSREAIVTVSDAGSAFDPLGVVQTARPATLAAAEPGGLGLTMIRGSADSLSYRYFEGRNKFSFGVWWDGAGNG
jgi:anti-sigma regulatory factor (Ser/Thr protein kinase)